MSFRFADLKKSVRKAKDGHQITPARLEGRQAAFQIEFLLNQFEEHLGKPRRTLDPEVLLEFVGDAKLGRGLLATLAQWYRMRARTFAEVLGEDGRGAAVAERLAARAIAGPVDLRAWVYASLNYDGDGYLEPEVEEAFWHGQARALCLKREGLRRLMLLDSPEEAVLVRTAPRPTAGDVMAAYNARAQTTLLRSARVVTLYCNATSALLERAAQAWAAPLGVEWEIEPGELRLHGRADALGCWTRHGRRVERAALELLALPELKVSELHGRLEASDKTCRFVWRWDQLERLGAGSGGALRDSVVEEIEALAGSLRRERERTGASEWGIRQATHVVAAGETAVLPHLELRRGDRAVYLRGGEAAAVGRVSERLPFAGIVANYGETVMVHFAGGAEVECPADGVLRALGEWLDGQTEHGTVQDGQRLRKAA